MSKRKTPRPKTPQVRNFVAKHSAAINKPQVHRDKKKDYQRTSKHRSRDFGVSFLVGLSFVGVFDGKGDNSDQKENRWMDELVISWGYNGPRWWNHPFWI